MIRIHAKLLAVAGLLALVATPALALTATDGDRLGQADLGYVAAGGTLEYQHTFDPFFDDDIEINSIESAWLYVAVVDDWSCTSFGGCLDDWMSESEVAAIDLNSVSWQTGEARATIFWGDVTAEADLLNTNGTLDVSVNSSDGDFMVLWSNLITTYDYDLIGRPAGGGGTGASPMPEPNAALVFAIGAVVTGGTIRRRPVG